MARPRLKWNQSQEIPSLTYVCGYCGDKVGPNRGYTASYQKDRNARSVYTWLCSSCSQPTFWDVDGRQWPGVAFGAAVEALPTDIQTLYDEARRCMSVAAYNTAVMACRKLLMHIAEDRGAGGNRTFKQYLDWLVENHYVPPGGEGWVDRIRDHGNNANHEIELIDQQQAEQTLSFTEFLLKFVYELPARAGLTSDADTELRTSEP
jgi:hypothetical protein